MDFDFNEEQRALQDTVRRFVSKDYSFEMRRKILDTPAGWSRSTWQTLAGLGVLALNIDDEFGGLGFGPLETALVMNVAGAGLLLEPFLAAAVVAPALIQRATSEHFQHEWLPKIAGGEAIVIPIDGRTLTLSEGCLSGRLPTVVHGGCADLWLIAVGDGLFSIRPDVTSVAVRHYPLLDGQPAAELSFDQAPAQKVGVGDTALAFAEALDIGLAALCAEAVGVLDATVTATTDYLKSRQQFGQPIGRFQALQHRMADMLLHLEQARSVSWLAAMRCNDEDASERQRVLSAAKVVIGNACRFIAQNAVQLHGGMGMSDELIVSHWFKRLTVIEMSFGDTDYHLQRFAQLSRTAA